MSDVRARVESVAAEFDGRVRAVEDLRGEPAFVAEREVAHAFIRRLRDDGELRFDLLHFITGLDNYLDEPRFEVVYNLRSLPNNFDVRINVPVPGEEPEADSITDLYPAADWMEREVWDMFGVRFKGHPDLTRILMWEGFEAHPLRKDYPLLGNTPGTPGYLGKGGKL
jgi:NADH-quinone oxidoreductase subunit C